MPPPPSLRARDKPRARHARARAPPSAAAIARILPPQLAFKLLASNNIAGSLIGKGGQTISALQAQSNCRIKISQSNDFFPGTGASSARADRAERARAPCARPRACLSLDTSCATLSPLAAERIVLVTSTSPQSLATCSQLILGKICEELRAEPEQASMLSSIDLAPVRANLAARFLLPNAAAGMVIGKGGTQIRQIIDETGAKLKLSAKDETGVHTERVLTVGGSLEQICKAHAMIVLRMADDPTYASYHNTSPRTAAPRRSAPRRRSRRRYATIGAPSAAGVQPPTMYSTFIHHHQAPPPPPPPPSPPRAAPPPSPPRAGARGGPRRRRDGPPRGRRASGRAHPRGR